MTSSGIRPARTAAVGALLVGVVASCARPRAPSGGDPDTLPPVVVTTRPDTFQIVEDLDQPVRIQFSERISRMPTSGSSLDRAVSVSPRIGEIRVSHESDALEIELAGGIRPNLVYSVTVRPVVKDLFDNPLREPFELVFSTGASFVESVVAGMVLDRITGAPVQGASVHARPVSDTTLLYLGHTDEDGIYTLRYLPPASYEVRAFLDVDRDGELDPFEARGLEPVSLSGPDSLLAADLAVLQPDTTGPGLARAVPVDSAVLMLTFDDYLDPGSPTSDIEVSIRPDSTTPSEAPPPPAVARVFHAEAFFTWTDSIAEVADSLQAVYDSLQAIQDSLQAVRDSLEAADTTAAAEEPEEEPPAEEEEAEEDEGPRIWIPGRRSDAAANRPADRPGTSPFLEGDLPGQQLYLLLDGALPPEVPYRIEVRGAVNVNGLEGAARSVVVQRRQLVRDTTPPDTATESADTAGQATDTSGSPPDASAVSSTVSRARPGTARGGWRPAAAGVGFPVPARSPATPGAGAFLRGSAKSERRGARSRRRGSSGRSGVA